MATRKHCWQPSCSTDFELATTPFMKRIIINTAIVAIFLLSARASQTNSIPDVNWGEPVCGVQIFTGFTNPVVKAGTSEFLCLKIRNSCTNAISLNLVTNLPPEMLANNIGKKYELP